LLPSASSITLPGYDLLIGLQLMTCMRSSILPLELWDTPGKEDIPDNEMFELLQAVHAVVFVLDVNVRLNLFPE
jgi:hypothetical protein